MAFWPIFQWSVVQAGLLIGVTTRNVSPGCGKPLSPSMKPGIVTQGHSVEVHDPLISPKPYQRYFSLFLPSSYDSSRPHSLFLDFHGFDDLAQLQAHEDGLFKAAEKEGFLVVYPKGMADFVYDAYIYTYYYYFNSWNGGGSNGTAGEYGSVCDGYKHAFYPCYKTCRTAGLCTAKSPYSNDYCGSSTCADDVGFVGVLLDKIMNDLCVDTAKVHGTAMSNGAIFLYYLATSEVGKRLASIIPVEGSLMLGHSAAPPKPIALMDIHGIYDDTVPANVSNSWGPYSRKGCPVKAAGTEGCAVSNDLWYYTPQQQILSGWVKANGCVLHERLFRTTDEFDGNTDFSCTAATGPECNHPVLRCTHSVEYNGGHTWPFHEGQPRFPRTERFGDLVWWFASQFHALSSRNDGSEENTTGVAAVVV